MADKRISELNTITGANTADDDLLVIVDTSASETKGITLGELEKALGERDFSFADDDKLVFGDGDDLQIYHDGSNSFIKDAGTGSLFIRTSVKTQLQNEAGTENYAAFNENGSVDLYYDNSLKLATTNTGIDVTGTVTADGLTVDGDLLVGDTDNAESARLNVQGGYIFLKETDGGDVYLRSGYGGSTDPAIQVASADPLLFLTTNTPRMKIDAGGDISFYEDTGTTAKFFWDASAESLGIGTSSPAHTLDIVEGADSSIVRIDGSSSRLYLQSNSGSFDIVSETSVGGANDLKLRPSGVAEGLTVDSTGNVGIGTSSPQTPLVISNSGAQGLEIDGYNASASATLLQAYNRSASAFNAMELRASQLEFNIGSSEAMRIDSSGNLLVGKTTTDDFTIAGTQIDEDGFIAVTRDGSVTGIFNRETSDGDILQFRKDNSTVGSIGSGFSSTALYIGGGDVGLCLYAGGDNIFPTNGGSTTIRDAAVDLGANTARFKDLYLSGGVYLGGTGAANHLDDYEEGTWTPSVTSQGGSITTVSASEAVYTKVGNLVTARCTVTITNVGTASSFMRVDGLPFSVSISANAQGSDLSNGQVVNLYATSTARIIAYVSWGNVSWYLSVSYFTS